MITGGPTTAINHDHEDRVGPGVPGVAPLPSLAFAEYGRPDLGELIFNIPGDLPITFGGRLDPERSQQFGGGRAWIARLPQHGVQALFRLLAERYAGARQSHLDGISIDYDDWHFNVRPSNTEPLLRLCLESLVSREDMERRRDEVLAVIRS